MRLRLNDPEVKIAPGMTGFARVIAHRRQVLAVPRDAVSSLSAGKGVVRLVDDAGRPVSTEVSLGDVDDRYVEITNGITHLIGCCSIMPVICATTIRFTLRELWRPKISNQALYQCLAWFYGLRGSLHLPS